LHGIPMAGSSAPPTGPLPPPARLSAVPNHRPGLARPGFNVIET
jgi:hypothetical protein